MAQAGSRNQGHNAGEHQAEHPAVEAQFSVETLEAGFQLRLQPFEVALGCELGFALSLDEGVGHGLGLLRVEAGRFQLAYEFVGVEGDGSHGSAA
jgi:hypothetical protein